MIKPKLEKLKEHILDLVFPKYCVGCGTEGEWVCKACLGKMVLVKTQVCPGCGRISKNGRYCLRCRKKHKLNGILVAAYYEEGPVKEAIHNLKYNHINELADWLGKLLALALVAHKREFLSRKYILTAVPMHWLKKARRGYNQAELLAESVDLEIEKNFLIINKIKQTSSQVKTSGKARLENLKNSIAVNKKFLLKKQMILVVDDVTTTGATLEECAKVLKNAGARKVWGLVVAKG